MSSATGHMALALALALTSHLLVGTEHLFGGGPRGCERGRAAPRTLPRPCRCPHDIFVPNHSLPEGHLMRCISNFQVPVSPPSTRMLLPICMLFNQNPRHFDLADEKYGYHYGRIERIGVSMVA